MKHDELRACLPRYAAGELGAEEAEAVRGHLATGCAECLEEMYRLPVGWPRTPPPPRPPATPVDPPAGARNGGRRLLLATVVLLALTLAALAGWTIAELRRREAHERSEAAHARGEAERLAARLTETAVASASLRERVATLEHERDVAREEVSRQAEAVRETAEASAQVRQSLEAAQNRIETLLRGVRRRDGEIDRLLAGAGAERTLEELTATPGLQMLELSPVAPFREASGHVLWHPGRDGLLVYAFDLPTLADGASYQVRLRLDEGRVELGPAFRPGARGDAAVPIRLPAGAGRLREVQVLREPNAVPVLAGRIAPAAG